MIRYNSELPKQISSRKLSFPEMSSTKTLTQKHCVFVLRGIDTLIKMAVLPLAYVGMYFLHQSKFTMNRPITMNI